MMKDRKLWPTDEDKKPIVAGFTVPVSPLMRNGDNPISGSHRFEVVEDKEAIWLRLKEQFPLYKLVQFGKNILRVGSNDEI